MKLKIETYGEYKSKIRNFEGTFRCRQRILEYIDSEIMKVEVVSISIKKVI